MCSAQSKNRYNSGIVLRKVGILTLSANSGIVPDNSRIAQGIYVENRYVSLRKVGIAGQNENSSNAEIHLETKQKKCVIRKRFECLIRKTDYSNNIATSFWAKQNEYEIIRRFITECGIIPLNIDFGISN